VKTYKMVGRGITPVIITAEDASKAFEQVPGATAAILVTGKRGRKGFGQ
jgi:hypothetical protein